MRAAHLVGLLVVAATVAVGTASASPARDALIRPGFAIGKIRLEMSLPAARRVLGKPTAVVYRRHLGFGADYVEYTWGASRAWRIGVIGRPGREFVIMVATTLAREKTRTGVGVGSTYAAVQSRLGARCRTNSKPGDLGWAAHAACFLGRKGGRQSMFSMFGTCNLPPRTVIVCPTTRRTYKVDEVLIGTGDGIELSGGHS
jgi:hypothetical protein